MRFVRGECETLRGKKTSLTVCQTDGELVDPYSRAYQKYGERNVFAVKDSSGKEVGEVSMKFELDEPTTEESSAYYRLTIDWVYIDQREKNKGYGADILKEIVEWARSGGFAGINVWDVERGEGEEERIALFEAAGLECERDRLGNISCFADF